MMRSVSTQHLKILPAGRIRGGTLTYTYHSTTGELYYAGDILLRTFFFDRRHRYSGKIQLDPRIMLSANVKTKKICVRSLIIQIVSVAKGVAHCTIQYVGSYPGLGAGVLDLTDEVVKLDWATGEGVVRQRSIFGRELVRLSVERRGD